MDGDLIQRDRGGYFLAKDPSAIDAVRFEEQVASALSLVQDQPTTAAALLREALGLWRGHPHFNVDGRVAFEPEIGRLNELRLTALEARIDAASACERHRELVGELGALTVEHPLRERFHAQQMLALYRCGRQTEALRAYERFRTYLSEEIGIDPGPDLQRLEEQILNHDPELDLVVGTSVSRRAVVAVEMAEPTSLERLSFQERSELVEKVAQGVEGSVEEHGGSGLARSLTADNA